jgi:hypothetical protein
MDIKQKLLDHYQEVMQRIKDRDLWEIRDILQYTYTQHGICYCALSKFDTDIYFLEPQKDWVKKYRIGASNYWTFTPNDLMTKEEILEVFKIRIDNLKKELSQ